MIRIIGIAQVKDPVVWEQNFRTHGDLFRRQKVREVSYKIDGDQIVICFETEDLDTFMELSESDETAGAMEQDGVIRESVRFHVLDSSFEPG